MAELNAYFSEVIEHRRVEPRDDLISILAAAADDGEKLDNDEFLAMLGFLLFAGHETTTGLIGNSPVALAQHPDQRTVLTSDVGPDADKRRLDRPDPKPLSFGHGIHHCLGASLARLEMRVAIPPSSMLSTTIKSIRRAITGNGHCRSAARHRFQSPDPEGRARSVSCFAVSSLGNGAVVTAANVSAARALVDRFDAMCTRIVASFSDSPVIREDGYRNISEWLAYNTHARPTEGEQRVAHAQVYTKLSGWSDAVDAGTIGVSHVSVVAKVVTKARLPFLVRDAADMLEWAQTFTFTKFRPSGRVVGFTLRRRTRRSDVGDRQQEARRVQLSPTSGGMWILNGLLDALGGEALSKALESAMPKPIEGDNRTPAQRRHDALVDIAHESLAYEDRLTVGGERPHVTVTVDAKSGIAHTSQMVRLSSFTRDMLLCDCVTTSIWLSADGTPFDVGVHKHRLTIRWDHDHASPIFEWPNGRTANSPPPPQILFAR